MTAAPAQPFRISSPAEIIEVVPYLLGFHPAESLVLLGLSPDGDRDPAGNRERIAGELLLRIEIVAAGLELYEVLLVGPDSWWSLLCTDERCCPPEGRPLATDGHVAAEMVVAGMAPFPDRDSALAQIAPDVAPGIEEAFEWAQRRMADASDEQWARYRRTDILSLRRQLETRRPGTPLAVKQLARYGLALYDDITGRDTIWLGLDDASITDPAGVIRQLATRLPAPYNAAPLFLLGWAAWRRPEGILAGACADRALADDPTCTAARLLQTTIEQGLNPRTTPTLREVQSS